jgi:macrolide transport system ATP-binding/permease protein
MSILSWLTRRRLDLDEQEFQDEMRAHLAIAEEERMADGADHESARYAALKDFGNVTLTTEAARRVWMPPWLEAARDFMSDVRYAIRALAKNPIFSLTVISVLGLGIGLNATVFSMLKGVALRPLGGVDSSARFVVLHSETTAGRPLRLSYPEYQQLRDHSRAFPGLMGSAPVSVGLGRGRSSRAVAGELVTGNYFQVLGVGTQLGRTLLPSDDIAPGRHPVIVLSDRLWRRDFGADPEIVGKTIEINNHPLTVMGVADPGFHGTVFFYENEVFIPVMMAVQLGFTFGSRETTPAAVLSDPRAGVLFPHGYLQPGTSLASAAAETGALWATMTRDRPATEPVEQLRVMSFGRSPTGGQIWLLPIVTGLSAMGLLVLMIVCANVAGLVLVRGVSRRGELAVRLALGATRTRIVRLLIVENLVLAAPGAALGVLLALQAIPVVVGYLESLAAPQPIFFNIEVDWLVIVFAVLVACGCALVFGFVPALRSSRVDLVSVMNEVSPRGVGRGRLRAGLTVAQVAVSLLLLVAAGLLTRSLEAARRADPGFDTNHVTAVAMDLRQSGHDERQGRAFYRRLLESVRDDAGIESAALAAFTPMTLGGGLSQRVAIDRYEPRPGEDLAFLSNTVGADYFRTLRINLMAGRSFDDRDGANAPPVVIVNNTLAQRFWGGAANAIGRRIRVGDGAWRTVIGVAANVKYTQVNELPRPYLYLPFEQSYRSSMILHTRGLAPADVLVNRAREHVVALDPDLPILYARPLAERVRISFVFLTLGATMLFVFGVTGMALAAMGTYGLVSYNVKQSTHEIGVRMALGASGSSVVRGFLVQGLKLGALGAALGFVAALGSTRLLGSALYGITATDVPSFASALAIVLSGVIVAALVPAWRAARTDPLRALRYQ